LILFGGKERKKDGEGDLFNRMGKDEADVFDEGNIDGESLTDRDFVSQCV